MEQILNNKKAKSKKYIIISTAVVVVLAVVFFGSLIYIGMGVWSFFGISEKTELSKYDNKIYSITSEDGKIQGFIATHIESIAEQFPIRYQLIAKYNILIKEPLLIKNNGEMKVGNLDSYVGDFFNIYDCDNADSSKIDPLVLYYDDNKFLPPLDCSNKPSKDSVTDVYLSGYDRYMPDELSKGFPNNIDTISVYDVGLGEARYSTAKLIKTYKVSIQQKN